MNISTNGQCMKLVHFGHRHTNFLVIDLTGQYDYLVVLWTERRSMNIGRGWRGRMTNNGSGWRGRKTINGSGWRGRNTMCGRVRRGGLGGRMSCLVARRTGVSSRVLIWKVFENVMCR